MINMEIKNFMGNIIGIVLFLAVLGITIFNPFKNDKDINDDDLAC